MNVGFIDLAEIFENILPGERDKNVLDDAIIDRSSALFGESFGLSHMDSISGLIGGALEANLIGGVFEKIDRIVIMFWPVVAKPR